MIHAFFYGLGTGVLLSAMLGTVFFCLVQNSIDNGFKSGVFISIGVIISDTILITLSYYNSNLIPKGSITEMVVRMAGAVFLIILGLNNIYSKRKINFPATERKGMLLLGLKGFTLNIFNPANFLSWLSVSALLVNVLEFSIGQRIWFYVGALTAIFGMEMLISYGASYLKKYISQKFLHYLNLVLGSLFIIFAVVLLVPLVKKLF